MSGSRAQPIIAIDLLRFACALMVLGFHFGTQFALGPNDDGQRILAGLVLSRAGADVTWFAWVGVEIFFVISGFVIAMSAEGASIADFIRRRALRLLPAAWICATITLAVLCVAAPSSLLVGRYLTAISFWPVGTAIDPSYWTLGIEVVFYTVVAIGLGEAGTFASIERRALWIGALSTAFWLFMVLAQWSAPVIMNARVIQLLLIPHGCFFALGVLAWTMVRGQMTGARIAAFAVLTVSGFAEIAARTAERCSALGLAHGPLVPILVFAAGLAVVLGALRLQPLLARRVSAQTAATLGLMTYPLYLVHQDTGAALLALLMRAGLPMMPALLVVVTMVLTLAWWIARAAEPALRRRLASAIDRLAAINPSRAPAPDTLPSASLPNG